MPLASPTAQRPGRECERACFATLLCFAANHSLSLSALSPWAWAHSLCRCWPLVDIGLKYGGRDRVGRVFKNCGALGVCSSRAIDVISFPIPHPPQLFRLFGFPQAFNSTGRSYQMSFSNRRFWPVQIGFVRGFCFYLLLWPVSLYR